MSFWDDLSPSVKRYLIVGVLLGAALLGLRTCAAPGTGAPPPPRGVVR
jgi:hypothetical protein